MSTYLSRLLARGRPAGGAVALQPFIRSRSPIAERDQRIGITGLEMIGSNGSLPEAAQPEPVPPPGAVSEPPPQAGINTDGGSGEVTLRRKPDNAAPIAAVLSIPTAVTHSTSGEGRHSIPPRASSAGIADRPDPPMQQPVALPERVVAPNLERSPVATDGIRSQDTAPSDSDSEVDARSHPVNSVVVRKQPVRATPQVDTALRLEPAPRTFPDLVELSATEPGRERAAADAGPRMGNDHVNVEVVPPVATETRVPSRPGPLTAASVSVIGPLGGNLSSRLAFGLRYR